MKINLTVPQCIVAVIQLLALVYGITAEFKPSWLPGSSLPSGMGLTIIVISATMGAVLIAISEERFKREELLNKFENAKRELRNVGNELAKNLSVAVPVHEHHFYALWQAQVKTAQHSVDVCHLGPTAPRGRHGGSEQQYFEELVALYKKTNAQVRRVERLAPGKRDWIRKLMNDFNGTDNFSLAVYCDDSKEDLLSALSVSRIDDQYGWLVAIAEHESTTGVRDLLITGEKAVSLLRDYFATRLWDSPLSKQIMIRGVPVVDWEVTVSK